MRTLNWLYIVRTIISQMKRGFRKFVQLFETDHDLSKIARLFFSPILQSLSLSVSLQISNEIPARSTRVQLTSQLSERRFVSFSFFPFFFVSLFFILQFKWNVFKLFFFNIFDKISRLWFIICHCHVGSTIGSTTGGTSSRREFFVVICCHFDCRVNERTSYAWSVFNERRSPATITHSQVLSLLDRLYRCDEAFRVLKTRVYCHASYVRWYRSLYLISSFSFFSINQLSPVFVEQISICIFFLAIRRELRRHKSKNSIFQP